MDINGWKYYNHAAVPATAPNEEPDLSSIYNSKIWKLGRESTPLLARWTTDFDCGYETNWWYVVKDTAFDITKLKAKRRYEINKGIKNFEVKLINPICHKKELYSVQVAAFSAYPKKYRPVVDKESFISGVENWETYIVFGAFFRETGELAGYALLSQVSDNFINFSVLKTNPVFEKYSVNAALCERIVSHFDCFLSKGGIICDGSRSISHETNFQDYLEKYFGFRKAYCKLHIAYNPRIKWLVKMLCPFRRILQKFDKIGFIHQINSVLYMEELCRSKAVGK